MDDPQCSPPSKGAAAPACPVLPPSLQRCRPSGLRRLRRRRQSRGTTTAAVKKKRKPPPPVAGKGRAKKDEVEAAAVFQLSAERFLPFLSRALKLLPSSLRKCPWRRKSGRGSSLWCTAWCLIAWPAPLHHESYNLLFYLVTWGKNEEAEESMYLVEVSGRWRPCLLVRSRKRTRRPFAGLDSRRCERQGLSCRDRLTVDVISGIMRCGYMSKTNNGAVYRLTLSMVEEVHPWLRPLDFVPFEKN